MAHPSYPIEWSEDETLDMIECARHGEMDELLSYLERGMDVNYVDKYNNTALHKASANGHLDIVKLLVDTYKAKSIPNQSGNTPLNWAVQNRHKEVVRFLLAEAGGTDAHHTNEFGKDALSEAVSRGDEQTAQIILCYTCGDTDTTDTLPCQPVVESDEVFNEAA
eukprot:GHVR01018962.1.p1 GENE.GHVR01018962.1~~GHVR01018962.1.p1  ORF type:complete len:165 (-),score=36.01 GHVR01018962.1:267-761(-)